MTLTFQTLEEARQYVLAHAKDGVSCPCCNRRVKEYQRNMNREMALFMLGLVALYYETGDWVHYKKCFLRAAGASSELHMRHDYGYVQFWGLAVKKANVDPTKNASGFWKPTELGVQFAQGQISVRSYIKHVNDDLTGWSEQLVTVQDALGTELNYAEILKGNGSQ